MIVEFMARTQVIEHPTYLSVRQAIEIAETLVKTFKNDAITIDALASIMKHRNAGSGTFLKKLSDLKKYGIIDGKRPFYTTQLARDIAIPTSDEEKQNAIRKMVFNIEIIRKLYDVFKSNVAPTDNDILIQLINITKEDKSQLQPILAEISNLYKDALPYISVNSMPQSASSVQMQSQAPIGNSGIPAPNQPQNLDVVTISDEGIAISIKKDREHLETAKELIDLYLKKFEPEAKKPKKAEKEV